MLKQISRLFGSADDKVIKKLTPIVNDVNALESEFEGLTDEQLREKTWEYRTEISQGVDSEDLMAEAFALVREAAKRTLGQRHYDVQIMGGAVLQRGQIAEMRTGEGKTLVSTLAAYLNSLDGKGVHLVTVNDYLARRDAQWMGAIFELLDVSVGILQHDISYAFDTSYENDDLGMEFLRPVERRDAYRADITYGTNNEFGFDYLRDNMVPELDRRVQRPLNYAIVDEVDNILIDEARTPLIISGPSEQSPQEYVRISKVVPNMVREEDFTIDEKHRTVALSNEGINKLERLLKVKNLYDPDNFELVHFVENALKAELIYIRDQEYVVQDGEVIIVDEFTGRLMEGRRYSDGLHQAIEAKESVKIQRESVTYATITLQNYFRLYKKLAGMTGTAATEAEEFFKIYKLEVVTVPTNKPMIREDFGDYIYKNQKAKYDAVINEIVKRYESGQPVLVGTTDIDRSEEISDMLMRRGIPHEVLNAKQHEREAPIVAQAGRPGAVTVATNMAGRGTDIVLGGNPDSLGLSKDQWEKDHETVVKAGGLHIIGTERHDARRIDNQLRGRSGRQGDPGSSRFYVALDDELMRRFGGDRIRSIMEWAGIDDDTPIENRMISKSIEGAQVKVESYHFDIRKHLVEYDDVVNTQRDVIYAERDKILGGADLRDNIREMVHDEIGSIADAYLNDRRLENMDVDSAITEFSAILPPPPELANPEAFETIYGEDIEEMVLEHSDELYGQMEELLTPESMRILERQLMLRSVDINWVHHLTSMENLRTGIGLHAYGQRDPLVMYKKEGQETFQGLLGKIKHDIVRTVYHIGITQDGQAVQGNGPANGKRGKVKADTSSVMKNVLDNSRRPVSEGPSKVGRNQQCPCGSGKKYKRCHGA